nr:carboxypeptidase inhibitor SmCI-like [Pogona vitticeps]
MEDCVQCDFVGSSFLLGPPPPLRKHPNASMETTAGLRKACTLPPEKGPCEEVHVFYYYNIKSKKCETFLYGGCLGNNNKFPTADACKKICGNSTGSSTPALVPPVALDETTTACTLPPQKGPCREDITRYYYNAKSKRCETFLYGGCMGNDNNFLTEEICKQACKVSEGSPPSSSSTPRPSSPPVDSNALPVICTLTPVKGRCHGHHTRYYYNVESHSCKMFVYGGCLGNGNRFYTMEECLKRCRSTKEMPIVCRIPKDSGTCSQRLIRYYYDQASGSCETFVYSGCDGNANHFHSIEECQTICSV